MFGGLPDEAGQVFICVARTLRSRGAWYDVVSIVVRNNSGSRQAVSDRLPWLMLLWTIATPVYSVADILE